jgi:hypothetical protein
MFFRREKPHVPTFSERLSKLKDMGFLIETAGAGKARAIREGCAADLVDRSSGSTADIEIGKAGVLVGGEIGLLIDQGFQKTFQTPSRKQVPALARHLKTLHAFQEDLREGLGLTSLYNESLGTTNDLHLYDRVAGRDAGPHTKPWDRVH